MSYSKYILILIAFQTIHGTQFAQSLTPDTVNFRSGNLQLKGLLWKQAATGLVPAVLYNHGSELHPEKFLSTIAPAFVEHGYAFFVPFRRGQGLSRGQGKSITDVLDSVRKVGPTAGFKTMITLHETSQLQDQLSALAFLKVQPGIDSNRIAVAGISFGGIQAMLMASEPSGIKAALNFAGAAMVWEKSKEVSDWLKQVALKAKVPIYFIQAENDFSVKPSLELSKIINQAGKPYWLKIYPAHGKTPMEGHAFVDAVNVWGPDVFPQLDLLINKK